jgi:uncharacterized protein YyaL (SSP411 family)
MPDQFRYSPRENRAAEIRWRPWGPAAFEEAASTDRPILLNLTAVWCRACQEMDETTYSDDGVIRLLNEELVPIRVDADRRPHVQDRYIAGGWPTNALLTPTGEVFWSGTYVDAGELTRVARGVLKAWRDDRDDLEKEIERRRRAMEAARSRRPTVGIVRREAADDVISGAEQQFDPRNGGFGDAPKFVHAEAVEMLYVQGEALPNPDWIAMAERTLDGMMAGEIEDEAEGGFFHYALEADWTRPQVEKLLSLNARALHAFAFGAARTGRDDWAAAAERTVEWVESTLQADGLWRGSQFADPEYFALDAGGRAGRDAPPLDSTVYTDASAMWIASLADAGQRMGRADWVDRASAGLDTLLDRMAAPGDSLTHYANDGAEPIHGLLVDLLHGARAALAVGVAANRDDAVAHSARLAATMKETLWEEAGGFADHPRDPQPLGALRYRDRPFEENALAARLFLGLARHTGEGSHRAVAERTLALLSPLAGRYAVEGASFAMAVEEFFELRRR